MIKIVFKAELFKNISVDLKDQIAQKYAEADQKRGTRKGKGHK